MAKLRIIVGGFIGLFPAGGVAWDYAQYPAGLRGLGHDVYYVEDTRNYPAYRKDGDHWTDATSCVDYLEKVMDLVGMSGRWAYRDEASGKCFGMSEEKVIDVARTADLFVNVSCASVMRDEYSRIPARVIIDTDPMFTQIQYLSDQTFTPGESSTRELIGAHNYHFSFGENIGAIDSSIPECGIYWQTTRQPICLDHWKVTNLPASRRFTTLMNWAAGKALIFDEEEWGQKDREFRAVLDLPADVPEATFAIAVAQTAGTGIDAFPASDAIENGWEIMDPHTHAFDPVSYRRFIERSFGELSVAKQTYVKGRTGWFSCRSACYLAMGRPVITQETGWSRNIPTGEGLFSFEEKQGAADAVRRVLKEPKRHSIAARKIAEEYFDSRKVLTALLDRVT